MKCPPEYAHIFCDRRMQRILIGEYCLAVVFPSAYDDYWHIERFSCAGYVDGFKKPVTKDGGGYFLKNHFKIAADNWILAENVIKRTPEEEVALWNHERALLGSNNVVYFLKAGPFIKIGLSASHPILRIEALQTACPYKITLLGMMNGNIKLEKTLHKQFAPHHANLEWFHASEEILHFIRDHTHVA